MKGKTHLLVGIASSLVIAKTFSDLNISTSAIYIGVGMIGGLLPDIDHPNSKLGRKIPILPNLLKHRGFTHTIYFLFLCFTILFSLRIKQEYIIAFTGALFSHLLCDLCTPAGLKIFSIFGKMDKVIRIPIIHRIDFVEVVTFIISLTVIYDTIGGVFI